MAKKAAGKAKKKAAAPAYETSPEALAAFGFQVNELVRTPLGLSASVLGIRFEQPGDKDSARLWVRYSSGHEAPLEPKQAAGALNSLGYRHCAEADAIRAAVAAQEAEAARDDEARARAAEVQRLLAAGEPVPEHLLPAEGKDKEKKDKKGEGGGDGKKKKK
ncbi:hypothetical protein Rsub_04811 [Raphidocelis subcapitata]|uniref:Uncharacterized protein n=1 Tax=Raphidocelis subcapitata TaxID=307507 RepID=A0A2V0NWT6_9CHLO|nr:hypothetical protein Rsub_04811 [Raphidocelis subcapitata]|eukprot:GBF91142.1 hypothetical protein Rsub_04811 [Raphidocelis subcapitata]